MEEEPTISPVGSQEKQEIRGSEVVEEVYDIVSVDLLSLKHRPDNFVAGNISQCYEQWLKLTSDKLILDTVKYGYEIEFMSEPCDMCNRSEIYFNDKEKDIVRDLLSKLYDKRVIEESVHEEGEIISHIFIRPKADGSYRLILNLSRLNDHIEKVHFKMETLKNALQLVKQSCYFGKIDLKDAYFSVGIQRHCRKLLKFSWEGKLFQFTCLANGLSPAPRVYTKLLKPMFAMLRKLGHSNVPYIDDSLLQSDTKESCAENLKDTVLLMDDLGLTVHPDKSVIIPTQCIEFVGFLINSVDMTVRLTPRKAIEIKNLCISLLDKKLLIIRDFAKLIGKLVAAEPGVLYAGSHYKSMEIDKDMALKRSKGDFDACMELSVMARDCMRWWIDNVQNSFKPISHGPPQRRIETDSSTTGYGGHDVTNDLEISGIWDDEEKEMHINYLELKAAYLCLQAFCSEDKNQHIHLFVDNRVALKYLSKMGGRKRHLNKLAREIWVWCEKRNLWLSVFHIPSSRNVRADQLSRAGKKLNEDMEWALDSEIFSVIQQRMGQCQIDLFASAHNHKLPVYCSYVPDGRALAINAFSLTWANRLNFAFPPFSCLAQTIQKLVEDEAELILIAPLFPTQTWFPHLLKQVSGDSYILPKVDNLLYLPRKNKTHRLTSMRMVAFRLSGNISRVQEYQQRLPKSSLHPGETVQLSSMGRISKNGCTFVVNNRLMLLTHL
ncbi:MAG: hypothetical protein JAY75_18865 [Candidatus Thiodiazotropha taylori]|nr:hypothetical protein [Candidatus Thiodiazotropha taylori]MCW4310282.1 reverse transcriptase domain-containing protein [Candidatus Thiodiazotropha endolucinida]MCG8078288.1 hypothetical protein [Candidatus Thiodiazotropha taylori]MCG8112746.1 hypothetical protein [Candidatus Thiodiazotropha taylori]MCW4285104.1 reverse transcriptase domain-containing protein [Candidatus Thiodiazotropha taylori]